MALNAKTLWECNASSTANMVNGGGFNTANANFPTDGSITSANTSAPVLSSATYSFVAGDASAWVYLSNVSRPGFYQISSVAGGNATLNATAGAAVLYDTTTGICSPSTATGCDSSASVSSKAFGVDYSQATAAIATNTDLTCTAASTTVTSAGAAFRRCMVGNIIHLTALTGTGAIVGWYEVVNYTSGTQLVLDRTPTDGVNNITAGTYYLGGALSLNSSLDDSWYEAIIGGNHVHYKNGTYTLTSVSVASTSGTVTNPVQNWGYNAIRGDNPKDTTRPTLSVAATNTTFGQNTHFSYLIFTGTASTNVTFGTNAIVRWCKFLNTSSTSGRVAMVPGAGNVIFACEGVSQNGTAFNLTGNDTRVINCFAHDSTTGFSIAASRVGVWQCIAASCRTYLIQGNTSSPFSINKNTLFGYSGTPRGTAVSIGSGQGPANLLNNIIAYCATGIANTTAQVFSNFGSYNAFYGNTTDVTLYTKDATDISGTDPQFTDTTELSGSTATISGTTLTQTGAFSTVTDNVDYIQVHSGTGATVGIYLITSHTADTVTTNNTIGTNATTDKVWSILHGKNFAIGTNLKAMGYPGVFPGGFSTGYTEIGAVQRQEAGGGGSTAFALPFVS